MVISGIMRWMRNVVRTRDRWQAHIWILLGILVESDSLEDPDVDESIILKGIFTKSFARDGLD
jgi:hypothetical protein